MALWEELSNSVEQKLKDAQQWALAPENNTILPAIQQALQIPSVNIDLPSTPTELGADQQVSSAPVLPQQEQQAPQDNASGYSLPTANDLVSSVEGLLTPSQDTVSSLQGTAHSLGNLIVPQSVQNSNAFKDAQNKTDLWAKGIAPGLQEVQTAAQQIPDMSSAEMPGGAGLTSEDQQALEYNQKAVNDFTNQSIKPVVYTAGLIPGLGAAGAAAGYASLPLLAGDFQNEAEQKGVVQAAKDFSGVGAAERVYNDPQGYAEKFAKEPISTAAEVFPAAILAKMAYKGGKSLANSYVDVAKSGETVGRDMQTQQPIDPVLQTQATNTSQLPDVGAEPITPVKDYSAQPHQELVDAVEQKLNPSIGGLLADQSGKIDPSKFTDGFLSQDVAPLARDVQSTAGSVVDYLSPASKNDMTRSTADAIREYNGTRKLTGKQTEVSLENAKKYWDSKPKAQQIEDAIAYQKGELKDENLQPYVTALQEQLNQRGQVLQNMGVLDSFNKDYLPQIWADTPKNRQVLGSMNTNVFRTSSGFLKAKNIPDYETGIKKYGMEPKYTNPVDMAMERIAQEDRYIMGEGIKNELSDKGLIKLVKAPSPLLDANGIPVTKDGKVVYMKGGEIPEGWKQINAEDNPLGANSKGAYYAPPEVAKLIENTVNKGWQDVPAYKRYMEVANTMNQFQLLGGFHVGFTSFDTMVTKGTLGVKLASDAVGDMVHGKWGSAANNIVKAITETASAPIAPYTTFKRGGKLIEKLLDPTQANDPIVRAYKASGAAISLDKQFTTKYYSGMTKAFVNGNYVGAGIRVPFAMAEKLSGLILEKLVPRQKAGVFDELMHYELNKHPEILNDQAKLRSVASRVADTIDNRLGQVNWDNLFLDPKFKQSLFVAMRAPGWAGGTIREIGGGVLDLVNTKKRLERGEDFVSHRMAYDLALPMVSYTANYLMQWLMTSEQPDIKKEGAGLFFKFKNGQKDDKGNDKYFSMPSYMKDLYAYYNDPVTTIENKQHPFASALAQLGHNKDYYGTQIRNPKDDSMTQAKQVGEYFLKNMTPFSITGAMKSAEDNGGVWNALKNGTNLDRAQVILPQIGINKTPRDITDTAAQKKINEIKSMTNRTKTPEDAEKSQMIGQIRHNLAIGKITNNDIVKMVKAGVISEQAGNDIIKNKNVPGIVRAVKNMTVNDLVDVYKVANDEEKAQLKNELIQKIDNAYKNKNTTPEQKKQYYDTFVKVKHGLL